MALKSADKIRRDLALRNRILRSAQDAPSGSEFAVRASASAHRAIDRLTMDLENVGSGLDWSIDGPAVRGRAMELRQVATYSDAIGRTFRYTARDIMHAEGMRPLAGVKLADLVEPVAAGFDGSFGLKIEGSNETEQLSLEGTLFDRTANRVVSLLAATAEVEPAELILDNLAGMRKQTLKAIDDLCAVTVKTGNTSSIRWRGQPPIAFDERAAQVLSDTIQATTPDEYEIEVTAVMELGALGGRFHLQTLDDPPENFWGKLDPTVNISLLGVPVGATVRARLLVIETDSPILDKPKRVYLLREIEKLSV